MQSFSECLMSLSWRDFGFKLHVDVELEDKGE